MSEMFCFQCQQTAGGSGCVRTGRVRQAAGNRQSAGCPCVPPHPSGGSLRRTGRAPGEVTRLLADGLFTTLTNVNFDSSAIRAFTERVEAWLRQWEAPAPEEDSGWLWQGETDMVSLRATLLFGLKGMAAYAHHAMNLGYEDAEVSGWFYKGLCGDGADATAWRNGWRC